MIHSGPYAAIFDMDGVLVNTYRAHYRSWLEMAEPEGLHFSEAAFAPTFGRTSREIIACFWGKDRYNDAQIADLDARKEAAFRRIIETDFPAMPGVDQLLGRLHQADFRLAVGSSGPPENVDFVLQKLGAGRLFDAVVTGSDVARGKPDPQVFLVAAERLAMPPARCAVIEDAPAGIAAAHAAGMASVGLVSTGRTLADLAAAGAMVRSLDEISPPMLRALIDQNVSARTQGRAGTGPSFGEKTLASDEPSAGNTAPPPSVPEENCHEEISRRKDDRLSRARPDRRDLR